jgi:CarboxypepD_reg-like domain
MKKLLYLLVAVIFVLTAAAKEKGTKSDKPDVKSSTVISGTVTDEKSGESLVGVEVKLEGTNQKAYTDFDGNFTFTDIKPGKYNIVATYISYKKARTTVSEPQSEKSQVNIKLQSSM